MVVGAAVPYCGNRKLLVSVVAADREPVQLAPVGQQAMLSAASRAQRDPFRQHILGLSRVEHGL